MDFLSIEKILGQIGGIAGTITTLVAFVGLISKRPRQWFTNTIREESRAANAQLEEKINMLLDENEKSKNRDLVTLRHAITTIYEEYKDRKRFPTHIKEDVFSLYAEYEKLGGNSYVHAIEMEMENWETD